MKYCISRILAVGLLLALPLALVSRADDVSALEDVRELKRASKAFSSIAKRAMPAMVFIHVEKTIEAGSSPHMPYHYNDPFDFFGDEFFNRFFQKPQARPQPRRFRMEGQGSGFLISDDGYILTNNHVVGDADKITVKTHDGKEYEATRVGTDPKSEVALIKIDGKNLPHLPTGDSSKLDIGEWVIAIGNPFGLSETLTVGVVSAMGRSIGLAEYEDFIQTDAAINPGNSGGPLLNIDGEVIGINTAIYSRGGSYMGIGFAIPINMAMNIKDQLVEHGRVVRGFLGIAMQPLTQELAQSFNVAAQSGILVAAVVEDSAAAKAGIEAGDIILKLNNDDVTEMNAFRHRVSSLAPGTDVVLTLLRDGTLTTVDVTIGALDDDQGTQAQSSDLMKDMGMSVETVTPDHARRFGYTVNEGVIVTGVEQDGQAARYGIRPGDLIVSVNRTKVNTPLAFREALGQSDANDAVLLYVKNEQASRFIVIPLKEED